MKGLVFLSVRGVLVVPIGIDMPRAYANDILSHRGVGKTTVEITHLALIDIRIVIRAETRELVLITGTNERLDGLLLGIAVIIAKQQDVRIAVEGDSLR